LEPLGYADDVNIAKGRPYTLNKPASEHYPDTDHKLLTDGKFGADRDLDCGNLVCAPGWVGFVYGTPVITLDLENTYQLQRISVSFLSFPSKGVNPPLTIRLQSSLDGLRWIPRGMLKKGTSSFNLEDVKWQSRYLRFFVARDQWLFIDEITVTGTPASFQSTIQPQEEPIKRILVATSDLTEPDERLLRLSNLLDGMGLEFDMITTEHIDDIEFLDYQLLIFVSSSKIPFNVTRSLEQSIEFAVHNGTNVLWIGSGIWGSFKTTVLPDTFGVRYVKQDSNETIGVRYAEYSNLDGKMERLPLKHETMWVVEPVEAEAINWYLDDHGKRLDIPFITRMKADSACGEAVFLALPLLDRWKEDETYFTYARAEILMGAIRSLISDGVVGKHPAANAHDAVFMLRLEDYTPDGLYIGHGSRSWLIRMNRLLALTDEYQVPLNIGIIPRYNHPFLNETHDWEEQNPTIKKLKQMAQTAFDRGGSLIVHGFDHQNGNGIDDYSGDDWETYDEDKKEFLPLEQQQVITDAAYAEIEKTWGIKPVIWETPHYMSNADTFRAAHKSGFRYFTESDTKIFPNWNGYHNNSNGMLLNIPETGAFFQANFAEVKAKTLIKQLHILPRIVRMNALFLVFYHNMSENMYRALENLLMTSSNFNLWKPSMEEYAKFWEKRQNVRINSNIDREKGQIYARINDAFDGFTLAIQLPAGVIPGGMTINSQAVDVKTRQIGKTWILYPVLKEGTHHVSVTYK